MEKPPKPRGRPEDLIVEQIKRYLREREWLVKKTHGNQFQSGLPDLYCHHKRYGQRWIEVKTKVGKLESSQVEFFTELSAAGCGVWVLTGATDEEYAKLFHAANWYTFLKF